MTEARTLRSRGYSFAQLSDRLKIAKSTASLWTKDVKMGELGRERLAKLQADSHKRSGVQSHQRKLRNLSNAADEAKRLSLTSLRESLVILSMLYQCEGNKSDTNMCFTNSDSGTVSLFMRVLRNSFCIDETKLRVLVHVHEYHDDNQVKQYWSNITSIPSNQFYRSFVKKGQHVYQKEGYMGCAHIYYHDSKVLRVIRAFAKQLTNFYINTVPE